MARVPQFARPGEWQKPLARIEGERILKARAMEQRVLEQKAKVEAEARRVEEMESQKLDEKVDDLREQIDRLTDNIPKIIPSGGGGKRMVAKVLARDYPDVAVFDPDNFATAAQGALADTAVQPADIGTAAAEDVGYFATAAQGALANTAMQPATYDPGNVAGNAFAMDNMVEGADTKILTAAERAAIAALGTASTADLLDEDDFASDSATAAPSQQSTKAYVDNLLSMVFDAIVDAKKVFGVVGDGTTDDATGVYNALTFMAANGGSIIFPQNCLLNSLVEITSTTKGFNIVGGSFIVNNSTGGIKISPSSIDHRIYWSAHIYAGIATSGRPLEIIFPVPTSHRGHSVILDKCEFRPLVPDSASHRFTNLVRLENAWHGQANKCVFNGAESNNFSCPIGLELAGKSINFDVISCYGTNVNKAYSCGVDCEGFRAIFTNAVAVRYGFNFDATGADDPQAVLMGCHTNATTRAVVAINRNSVTIQGCLFYRFGTVAGYKDIEIVGGTGHVITGNSAYLGDSVENWFVHATDVNGMIVRDNYLTGRWHHVQLEGTSRNVSVSNNRQSTLVAASYADELVNNSSGSDNKLLHWKAESYSTTALNASGTTNDIDTATATAITWATVPNYNEMGGFASGSPTRITPPAWVKSVELSAAIEFASNSTGYRLVTIRRNGSTVVARSSCAPANGTATSVNVAPIRVAHTAGDYYEVVVTQNSGSTLSVASANTRFECRPVS